MIYTMYLPVFWGMNPGEPSFTRFQARKKCFLHWSLNHSCQLRGDLYNGLGLLLDDWGKSVFPRKVRAETQTWVGEQSSIGRQADQNYSDGTYYGNLELALISSIPPKTSSRQNKPKTVAGDLVLLLSTMCMRVSSIRSSPRCCSTRHDGDLQGSYTLYSLGIHLLPLLPETFQRKLLQSKF